MATYPYTSTGHNELSSVTPAGTDPVSDGDDALRQIKAFIKDSSAGLASLLGSLGENMTLRTGTSAPTPVANEKCLFLRTDTQMLYYISGTTLYPLMPVGGATTGKVLMSAGLNTMPTWSQGRPSRVTVVCATAPAAPTSNNTAVTMPLTLDASSGSHAAVSISSGQLTLLAGYTYEIRGYVTGYYGGYSAYRLQNITSGSTLQVASGLQGDYHHNGALDTVFDVTSTSKVVELQVYRGTVATVVISSVYQTLSQPVARLVIDIYPA